MTWGRSGATETVAKNFNGEGLRQGEGRECVWEVAKSLADIVFHKSVQEIRRQRCLTLFSDFVKLLEHCMRMSVCVCIMIFVCVCVLICVCVSPTQINKNASKTGYKSFL